MKKVLNSIYEAIGETPMLKLSRIAKHYNVEGNIFVKLEYLNPGFSKKDRPAVEIQELDFLLCVKQKDILLLPVCLKEILWKEHV